MPTIGVYLRQRPTSKPSESIEVTEDEPNVLKVRQETNVKDQVQYNFSFQQIFDTETNQEEIFETVGKPACDAFLEGYNATVFAYGQTGSGKTFTIEGASKSYDDRGLLPRSLEYVFDYVNNLDPAYKVEISATYLEIYNNIAYDLLSVSSGASSRLPKVTVQDRGTSVYVHGLSSHAVPSQEVAQNLFFLGRTNRSVARTSMNLQSSRSHSIFTLILSLKRPQNDTVIKSKLNLVDLAGSERVSKSGAQGQQLKEAKHINLSLHYLEAVIIALQQTRTKKHVPYRNSLLTKLLRDSLGGNCVTKMIANISLKSSNLHESVSTCRFAQRVAMVDNQARRNEVLDDKTIIKRLRKRVAELQAELKIAYQMGGRSEPGDNPESSEMETSVEQCQRHMKSFIHGKLRDPLQAVPDAKGLRYCLDYLRSIVLQHREELGQLQNAVEQSVHDREQLSQLKQKFGVTRARMRNMQAKQPKSSGYGRRKTVQKRSERPFDLSTKTSSSFSSSSSSSSPSKSSPRRKAAEQSLRRSNKSGSQDARKSQSAPQNQGGKQKHMKRAIATLAQLAEKEEEMQYAIQDLSEKIEQQRQVVAYCDRHAPHRLLSEKMLEREMEQDQAQLAAQLLEIQHGKQQIQTAFGLSSDVPEVYEDNVSSEFQPTTRSRSQPSMQRTSPKKPSTSSSSSSSPLSKTMPRAKQPAPSSPQQSDPDLVALKQKEEATRRKLQELKSQLKREKSASSTAEPATPPRRATPQPTNSRTQQQNVRTPTKSGFMTGAQEQKARVMQIRKAMNAAKIIQKAWREHKYNS